MVRQAGFTNGQELNFTAEVSSGVVQGQAGRVAKGTAKVTYFNVDLKVAFKMSAVPYNVKNFISVTSTIEGYTDAIKVDDVDYIWTVSPAVPATAVASGFNSKQLVFKANTLAQGMTYNCKLSIRLKGSNVLLVRGRTRSFTTPVEVISRPLRTDFKSGLPFIK